MITSSDDEYLATKRIKQGQARLIAPFDELAVWIGDQWGVTVLNAIYDQRNELHAPRIQIILEHYDDAHLFRDGLNFDPAKQKKIADKFSEIVQRHSAPKYDISGLFVVFSAFAPLAWEEADAKITEADITALKRQLGNPALWTISRCFGHVTFMFHTDAQVAHYTAQGMKSEYAQRYFELLKPHDEFGYLSAEHFSVHFDSKQNFDDHYQSNWYYYYK